MVKEPNSFIEKMPLSEKVYRILAKKIIDGKLVPGTKLKEKHVAEELGVSPTPVREAFKKLSGNGFVEINPYNGAVVKGLDEKEINDVYCCREALEKMALSESITKFSDKALKELFAIVKKESTTTDMMEISVVNKQFHRIIFQEADNKTLIQLIDMLDMVISRDMKYSSCDNKRRREICKEHTNIANAIKNCDVVGATAAMELHIKNGRKYIEACRRNTEISK